MKNVAVTLLTKPGCHLCDTARQTVTEVIRAVQGEGVPASLTEIDILTDPQLTRKYAEDIPVVLIGKRRHSFWHVDAARLTAAVRKAAGQ